jgi:chromosomal replication initiation ATPase DnaA
MGAIIYINRTEDRQVKAFRIEYFGDLRGSLVVLEEGSDMTGVIPFAKNINIKSIQEIDADISISEKTASMTLGSCPQKIIKRICNLFGVDISLLRSEERGYRLVMVRRMIYLVLRQELSMGYTEMANLLHHTHQTVMHGIEVAKERIKADKDSDPYVIAANELKSKGILR